MEHARARLAAEAARQATPQNPDAAGLTNLHRLLGMVSHPREQVRAAPPMEPQDGGSREWSSTLALVQTATEGLRQIEERIRQAEAQSVALSQRAFDELKAAEARIQNLEARARAAEARALDAETRLRESDDWLLHFQDTIVQKLAARRAWHAGEVVKLRSVG